VAAAPRSPAAAGPRSSLWLPVGVAALTLILSGAYSLYTRLALEDAFITYRYAGNLAAGQGLVYNPGDRVLGTTSPLLAIVLGACGALFGPAAIPRLSAVLMLLCGVAAAGAWARLLLDLSGSRFVAALAALMCVTHPVFLMSTSGGMETPLVLLLMAAGGLAVRRERPGLAGVLSAALILTRIDGALWAGIMAWMAARRSARNVRMQFGAMLIALAPFVALATWYYGSPIPHSIIAKRAIGSPGIETLFWSLARLRAEGSWWLRVSDAWPTTFLGLLAWLGAARCLAGLRANEAAVVLVGFPLAYIGVFLFGKAPRFPWYVAPPMLCTTALAALGVAFLRERVAAYVPAFSRRVVLPAMSTVLVAAIALPVAGRVRREFERGLNSQRFEEAVRRPVGEWLRDHTPAEATVAMEAIGYQGYYANRHVVDLAGLVSPEAVRLRRSSRTNGEAFVRILRDLRPDYVVLRSGEVEENVHFHGGMLFPTPGDRDFFLRQYRERARFDASARHGLNARITIYGRQSERRRALSADGIERETAREPGGR